MNRLLKSTLPLMLLAILIGQSTMSEAKASRSRAAKKLKEPTPASASASSDSSESSATSAKLLTDVRFTGSDVGGKYQTPTEGLATVENEKPLIDLIQPRREFTDRLRKSVTQR
jgi:hypothetical protein